MFTFADADGNTLKWVNVTDLGVSPQSGFFEYDGVPVTAGTTFTVPADEVSLVSYVAGSIFGSELFEVQVSDGQRLSTFSSAIASTLERIRVEVDSVQMVDSFEFVRLADLLDVSSSISPIAYEIIDLNDLATSSALVVNGAVMTPGEVHVVSGADFSQTFIRGGADDLGRSFDEFIVRVDNGFSKSGWNKINVSKRLYWGLDSGISPLHR